MIIASNPAMKEQIKELEQIIAKIYKDGKQSQLKDAVNGILEAF